MPAETLLDQIPLWALLVGIVAVITAAAECGYRVGQFRCQSTEPEKDGPTGAIVGTILGLLAFTLAFTFGLAATRYDQRRSLFQQEVNAIGTTYLRTDFLGAEHAAKIRQLLRDYVDVRLEVYGDAPDIDSIIAKSEKLHGELWAESVRAVRDAHDSEMGALYVESLNELIDLHALRVTAGLRSRIPFVVWGTLAFVSLISMAGIGYQAGLADTPRPLMTIGLILSYSLLLALIADLDRPKEGTTQAIHRGMYELRAQMGEK